MTQKPTGSYITKRTKGRGVAGMGCSHWWKERRWAGSRKRALFSAVTQHLVGTCKSSGITHLDTLERGDLVCFHWAKEMIIEIHFILRKKIFQCSLWSCIQRFFSLRLKYCTIESNLVYRQPLWSSLFYPYHSVDKHLRDPPFMNPSTWILPWRKSYLLFSPL